MAGLIRRLVRLSAGDWVMLARGAVALLRARVAYGQSPVRTLIRDLQRRSEARAPSSSPSPSPSPDGRGAEQVARLRWALAALGPRMPFRADCMIQVLAAERIVTEWGLVPQFFLGVERSQDDGFAAHVWLRIGDQVVTGGEVEGFTVMIGEGEE